MSDRVEKFVEKFVDEFEDAIDTRARQSQNKRFTELAVRQCDQLADSLDRLSVSGLVTTAITPEDLRGLHDELSRAQERPELEPLIANARALLTVVEDGIVDGDVSRLRAALNRAEELARSTAQRRGEGQPRLATPVRVRCTSCADIVVGRRGEGALKWSVVTKKLRDHEREQHGEGTEELGDDLSRALERLNTGEREVEAGRYEFGQS